MSGLASVKRSDVIRVLEDASESQSLESFVELYGYELAKTWTLRWKGRAYPSKAILGIAAGLAPRDFFGGVSQAVPALRRLGFEVRNGSRRDPSPAVKATLANLGLVNYVGAELPVDVASYFHSGSNRPGEIRGLAALGADVGVVAGELNA